MQQQQWALPLCRQWQQQGVITAQLLLLLLRQQQGLAGA
jgi:hypothetical protein